ncbi:MAG: HupE/UreJ family protein [Bacteroidales bacterium]|nr:HupE/UreJ family protein [Bacteroidales bacterium]
MSIFYIYLQLGFEHIIDLTAYDHILFIITLCAVYLFKEWKHVIILVTAFTIGHSITLALASLNFLMINPKLIEFLIPLTIFITAVANILTKKTEYSTTLHRFKYFTALIFGLVHGLGFSNYLKSLLGTQQSIIKPLLAFNLGLEIGQLIIVLAILGMASIMITVLKSKKREWTLVLSGAGLGISLILMFERSGLF